MSINIAKCGRIFTISLQNENLKKYTFSAVLFLFRFIPLLFHCLAIKGFWWHVTGFCRFLHTNVSASPILMQFMKIFR